MSSALLLFYLFYHSIDADYYISPMKLTWTDANTYCESFCGSNLATISNEDDQVNARYTAENGLIINTTYGDNHVWIGLNNITNGNLSWIDGSSLNYGKDPASGEPWKNGAGSKEEMYDEWDCVSMIDYSNYKWMWSNCSDHYRFICNHCDGNLNK
eukprot:381938_1